MACRCFSVINNRIKNFSTYNGWAGYIQGYGRFHNPTLKSPLIKCAFKVNATLNLK
jgi:hypothetical protein